MPVSIKFSIADVARVMVSISVFLTVAIWLRESEVLDSTNYLTKHLPFFIPVEILFQIGLGFAPFFELGMLAALIFLLMRWSPKPHTIILYLVFLVFGFAIPESASTRHFIILLVVSTTSIVECRLRARSDYWFLMPILCFGITLCYYLILTAALGTAHV